VGRSREDLVGERIGDALPLFKEGAAAKKLADARYAATPQAFEAGGYIFTVHPDLVPEGISVVFRATATERR
jgi:hypothetical protein